MSPSTPECSRLDATVLGNHDFDYSLENLLRLRDRAQYAMLSANTKFKEGKAYAGEKEYPFGDYITKEAAGLKFGIFGVTDDQSAATTLYSNTYDIEWDDDLTTAKTLVSRLKNEESCDVVIALSHVHSKNTQLITDNPAVDISIGGGNDIAGRPTIINGTQYLINPSKHGEAESDQRRRVERQDDRRYLQSDLPDGCLRRGSHRQGPCRQL